VAGSSKRGNGTKIRKISRLAEELLASQEDFAPRIDCLVVSLIIGH
jgi:Holliday junction resolvase-like predicted endonuclease